MLMGEIPFTPRAKKVLEYAVEESQSLGMEHIGTEHILLGWCARKKAWPALFCRIWASRWTPCAKARWDSWKEAQGEITEETVSSSAFDRAERAGRTRGAASVADGAPRRAPSAKEPNPNPGRIHAPT